MVENALTRSGFNSHIYFVTCKNKVLALFNCAILIHTLHRQKKRLVIFVLPLVRHVFFWVIIILHRRLH